MPNSDFKVTNTNTAWVFAAASNEQRHLQDIIFGIHTLRKRGVDDKCIYIFTDNPNAALHLAPFETTANVLPIDDLISGVKGLTGYEILILVVTGHGMGQGLLTTSKILHTPAKIYQAMHECPVKGSALILGQCQAGIFNFGDADTEPQICVLGATNLANSLSPLFGLPEPIVHPVTKAEQKEWGANSFLLCFFYWLNAPSDVDGDGKFSLVDAYKYSGIQAGGLLRQFKGRLTREMSGWLDGPLEQLKDPAISQLDKDATETTLSRLLDLFHLHQEPWISNPRFGKRIIF